MRLLTWGQDGPLSFEPITGTPGLKIMTAFKEFAEAPV